MKTKKYDSFYIGKVEDNKDPLKVGRLKIRVPIIHGDEVETPEIPDWAEPCFPFGGYDDEGFFFIPTIKARVIVAFINGDPTKPIWLGCQHSQFPEQGFPMPPLEAYEDSYVYRKQIKTPVGYILWDDAADRFLMVHRSGSYILFTEEGDINIRPTRNLNIEAPGNISISSMKGCINVHADQYANFSAREKSCAITSALGSVDIISNNKNILMEASKTINVNALTGQINMSSLDNFNASSIGKNLNLSSKVAGLNLNCPNSSINLDSGGITQKALNSSVNIGQSLNMISNNEKVQLAFE